MRFLVIAAVCLIGACSDRNVAEIPLAELPEVAKQGNANAQVRLGQEYLSGKSTRKDEFEAAIWFRKAADQGSAEGQNNLGLLYKYGRGVPEDEKQAVYWFRKAADKGFPNALTNLGVMLLSGEHRNESEALKLLQRAAKKNDAEALFQLGQIYQLGNPVVEINYTEAMSFYRKAADLKHGEAAARIGVFFERGYGVRKNGEEAMQWFLKAIDLGYDISFAVGVRYANGGDPIFAENIIPVNHSEALKWFKYSAKNGEKVAMYNIGTFYANGTGVNQDDAEAAKWFISSAKNGFADAQLAVGKIYLEGKGVKKDALEAAAWFQKIIDDHPRPFSTDRILVAKAEYYLAKSYMVMERGGNTDYRKVTGLLKSSSEKGLSLSQLELGNFYAKGVGVPQMPSEAVGLWRKSAAQGNPDAQLKLAAAYASGYGNVLKDHVLAYSLLNIAIANAPADTSINLRQALERQMSSAEINEARELAIKMDKAGSFESELAMRELKRHRAELIGTFRAN
jgi:TPR repeat protein